MLGFAQVWQARFVKALFGSARRVLAGPVRARQVWQAWYGRACYVEASFGETWQVWKKGEQHGIRMESTISQG